VASDGFIKQMMLEIETLASAAKGAATTDAEPDGQVSYDEFIAWFHETGVTYLDKPQYEASVNLEKPSDEELKAMFLKIDADGSGSIDLGKTQTLSLFLCRGASRPLTMALLCVHRGGAGGAEGDLAVHGRERIPAGLRRGRRRPQRRGGDGRV